jgi:hypothetical protein
MGPETTFSILIGQLLFGCMLYHHHQELTDAMDLDESDKRGVKPE